MLTEKNRNKTHWFENQLAQWFEAKNNCENENQVSFLEKPTFGTMINILDMGKRRHKGKDTMMTDDDIFLWMGRKKRTT